MSNRYTLSAYKSGAVLIKGIKSFGLSPNVSQILVGGSGSIDNGFAAVGSIKPQIDFTTSAIKTALARSGLDGVAMSSDTFYFLKLADGGVRDTKDHKKIVAAAGILVPGSLTAPQGQDASLSYKAHPVSSDGSASPLVITSSATFEAGQDAITEVYTMGQCSINGVPLSGVSQFSIDFGITVFNEVGDGDIYPKFAAIISRAPSIRITTLDVDIFATWGPEGVGQGATDSSVTLLSQTAGGVRGVNPITFSIDEGLISTENVTGENGQIIGHNIVITPVSDGTNAAIAITGLT